MDFNRLKKMGAVRETRNHGILPHSFGSTIDKVTGRTILEEVAKIMDRLRG